MRLASDFSPKSEVENMDINANYSSLTEVILHRSTGENGITFIESEENENFLSYRELYQKAASILYNLQKAGLKPGNELVFQVKSNQDFVVLFWACSLGKIIPVALSLANNEEYGLKLFNIWKILKNPYLITFKKQQKWLKAYAENNQKLEIFKKIKERTLFLEDIENAANIGEIHIPGESDIAYIQFSSGSTGSPKGVVLTYKNLFTNIRAILKGYEYPERGIDRYFSWMPLTHDLGMVGFHLTPLVGGCHQAMMTPQLFIRYPYLWIKKMSDLKSTVTTSPNFGYKHFLKHFDRLKHPGIDLSHIRIILNGAEPISPDVCDEFLNTLAPYGLRRIAMKPAYGMAEASLLATLDKLDDEVKSVYLARNSLTRGEKVTPLGNDLDTVPFVKVGTPLQDCQVKIADEKGNTCEDNVIGEILIKGDNVTPGYYNNSEATRKTITPDGWLKTGDLGFFINDQLVITGRAKDIIFVNGQNYYPHDLERVAEELEGNQFEKTAFCGVHNPKLQGEEIVCFVVFKRSIKEFLPLTAALKNHLAEKMGIEISVIIPIKKIPKTTSGKIQRFKLREQYLEGHYDKVLEEIAQWKRREMIPKKHLPEPEVKELIINTWCKVLDLEREKISAGAHFFDLGGNSKTALQLIARLQETFGIDIDDATLFKYPTINMLVNYFSSAEPGVKFLAEQKEHLESFSIIRRRTWDRIKKHLTTCDDKGKDNPRSGLEIAIIGMSGRFPGAKNIHEFWENIKNGVESIAFFSEDELREEGVDPQLLKNSNYVKAKGIPENLDYFDAAFFDYSPQEAETMDPQVRLFHECLWEALEDAGCDPAAFKGLIGIYAGASPNLLWNTKYILAAATTASEQFTRIPLNDKDFMATLVSYKLNMKGPSFTMYTACSTSLVAVDLACQGLLTGKCDMALAGGVSIWMPHKTGYLYEENMLLSRDGHNLTFDTRASGTVFSDGAAVVVLKRLEDAIADRDHIYAVIKGSAVNNDGNCKAGYTAPAVAGQAEVIAMAQQLAGVTPGSISYVEAHGTATTLGDPIEIDALTLAFNTSKKNCCAIGSIKSNVGHLNAAAGVAGLIKTALALKHSLIPPTTNLENPNPRIDLDHGPFYVNNQLKKWEQNKYPRRAGVSSFGIGGTNAHVILEEAPGLEKSPGARKWKLILLSARTRNSLENLTRELVTFLKENPGVNLADATYTLQVGRRHFLHRRMLTCTGTSEAVRVLSPGSPGVLPGTLNPLSSSLEKENQDRPVIFMFPGLGTQYVNMGRELYQEEPVFRQEMDRCFKILESLMAGDVKSVLYPGEFSQGSNPGPEAAQAADMIKRTEFVQPIVFIFGYALARLLITWGITPRAVIGYSFGEYIAACIAGVFTLEEALALVVARAQLIRATPEGAMLSVPLPKETCEPLLDDRLSIAVDNGPSCIASGPQEAIDSFEKQMKAREYLCIRVETRDALHSALMDAILTPFEAHVKKIRLREPRISYISGVSGTWITPPEALDPTYWLKQLRNTVQFARGIKELLKIENAVFLELGAGVAVSTIVRQFTGKENKHAVINLVQHPQGKEPAAGYLLNKVGRLWLYGVKIDWREFYSTEKRCRLSLPSCPFDRQYHPLKENAFSFKSPVAKDTGKSFTRKKPRISDWFYIPLWKQSVPILAVPLPSPPLPPSPGGKETPGKSYKMVLVDGNGFGTRLVKQWQAEEQQLIIVRPGTAFLEQGENQYTVNPRQEHDYEALFRELQHREQDPALIVHLWGLHSKPQQVTDREWFNEVKDLGYYSLIYMARALERMNNNDKNLRLITVTSGIQDVTGQEVLEPGKAVLLGPGITINQEYAHLSSRNIDIIIPRCEPGHPEEKRLIEQLLTEFKEETTDITVAYRNNRRWNQIVEPVPLEAETVEKSTPRLKKNGVYLITGGLGGIGFILAKDLAQRPGANLVLTGRTPLPPKEQWDQWLSDHQEDDPPNPISQKLKKIRQLETLGTRVLVFSADTADREKMEQIVQISEKQLGPINGVIHAAGIVGEQSIRAITEMDKADSEAQFQAKVHGLFTLERIFRDKPLDFCMLISSISSFLGGLGFTAYAAANLFMDAFARAHNRTAAFPWISVNWDMWQSDKETGPGEFIDRSLGELSMEPGEGVTAFRRALSWNNGPQLVVSTGDLPARLQQWVTIKPNKPLSTGDKSPVKDTASGPARRHILGAYVAPRSRVETIMTGVFREYLGIEQIGIHDNFFELGATSLELIRINNKLNELLAIKVPLVKLLTYTTIASFADYFTMEVMGKDKNGGTRTQSRSAALRKGKESLKQQFRKSEKRRLDRCH